MKKQYDDTRMFIDDLHQESLRDLTLSMGYLTEDDFTGSKVSCIFHDNDDTPSLQVTDNFFKCYSCGAKGDIIKWVELADSLNFIESLHVIAKNMNIELKNKTFSKYNNVKTKLNNEWKMYLQDIKEVINKKDHLSDFILNISKEYFPIQIGYDKTLNYIVLPFTSKTGDILGFTKRRVDFPVTNSNKAKWLHSSTKDSLIEYCSNIFNLKDAHLNISKTNTVYIVEGPKDVSAMLRAGVTNVIAICGAANFNDKILNILGILKKMYLVFDGDKAGEDAMLNNIVTIASINPLLAKNLEIIPMPIGEDPASIPTNTLMKAIKNPINGLNWFSEKGTDINIVNLIQKSNSSLIIEDMVILLNNKLGYTSAQSREWIKYKASKTIKNKAKDEFEYKDRLLSTIGECTNINIEPLNISESEAIKILKLRYNYK